MSVRDSNRIMNTGTKASSINRFGGIEKNVKIAQGLKNTPGLRVRAFKINGTRLIVCTILYY